ncbi:MAG: restriction endonuclease subunit S [Aequorivita sp.]
MGNKKALGLDLGTNSIGWVLKEWHEVLSIINGKNQKAVENPDGQYPIYGSGGIMNYANEYLCPENSTIVGRKGTINKPILVREKFWNVDTAFGLVAGEELDSFYLNYFCQSFDFSSLNKSTTLPSLAKRDLNEIKIPLPPLVEQQRIVAKLDLLFTDIDKAIRLLEENISHTKALMGSVLDEEFNKVKERGWPLLKFTEFASLRHGHQFRKYDFVESGIPVVKITQCKKDGSLDLSNCDYIDSSRLNEFSEDRIYKDDLLMALTGGTLGKVTWVENDYGELVQNYRVGNFFNIKGKSIKRFLMYILMSSIFQDLVASKVNQGAQPNIGKENIDNMIVPIPSLKEQVRMVEKFDIVIENQAEIIKIQTQKLNSLKALKSSLLDQAFRGEL